MSGPLENERRGRVMVFHGRPCGLPAKPEWNLYGDRPGQSLGISVAAADVNGDQITDLIVAELHSKAELPGGDAAIHVFLGAKSGLPATSSQSIMARAGVFGLAGVVTNAGDVNGDQCEDVAVVALDPARSLDRGTCVLVLYGSPTGLRSESAWAFPSEQEGCGLGTRLGSAGDVNGDGIGDLFVGAPRYTGRFPFGGKAYVFHGSRAGLGQQPAWTSEYPLTVEPGLDEDKEQFFGSGLGAAGDVNGDGFDDVLIGAWNASHGDIGEGAAFLYLGSKNGLAADPSWMAEANHPHTYLGYAVGRAGDLDADGFDDVMIGAPYVSHGQINEGVVLVYSGSKSGLAARPAWTFDGDRSNGHLGEFTSGAGDVNGDGIPDLLLAGADSAESAEPLLRVVVVYGEQGGLTRSSNWSPRKPPLAAIQKRLDRLGPDFGWRLIVGGTAVVMAVLLVALTQLRRRLARVVAENRQFAATQERTRIARDIHDHLGADLTRLAANLEQAAEVTAWSALRRSRDSAQQAVKTLDELVWATNPEQDSLEGLASYVAEFAPGFCDAHGLACELDVPVLLPAISLPARARHNLFLTLKEALRNVARHAAAKNVRVALSLTDHSLRLVIEDDGGGIAGSLASSANPSPVKVNGLGNGLANMRARAQELGAELVIEPCSPQGTRVAVTMPLPSGELLSVNTR